jgi:valyl-tRNA synthetase
VTRALPERPSLDGIEARWIATWRENGTYEFDPRKTREQIYSIDTPPPTVSGSLHVGHVFSYTQTDIVARYKRMRGYEVFYPIGWDDNGLPTERRVQNYFGVRCDPSLSYDPSFVPPDNPADPPVAISRPNFIELCRILTEQDEHAFEDLFRRVGLSVSWDHQYTTIGERSRAVSQRGFLALLKAGHAYRQEAPTLWDVDYRSAIAQAELEDREVAGAYHRLAFHRADGTDLEIDTTRPELLAACVACVAHPDDERYQPLFGTTVFTPLFGVEVPVHPHHLADPEKGTGIAMVCTFGDLTDVTWWRELRLATRTVIGRDGRLEEVTFGSDNFPSRDASRANNAYARLAGRNVRQAQREIVELLKASGELVGEPRAITHPVKFYERGERPLEIVSSLQWYVKTMDIREALIEKGRELNWHPEFMRARYESWVENLTGDWNISRQRFSGVPFPIWYPVRDDGSIDDLSPILADDDALPVDPSTDTPPGYSPDQRGVPGGFVADPDVMDTWATSSLTPQIAGGWSVDEDLFSRVFPMDLRPQAHEIIRTWLFSTMVRSLLGHDSLPWYNAAISGWILDPDRKKMSKSRGNVVVPTELLETHGTDAVRYWAASAKLGSDTIFDEGQMKIGRRLAIKILNASRFVLTRTDNENETAFSGFAPLDRALLGRLADLVEDATIAFENYEHARALERTEQLFWEFCDDYLELVKARAYSSGEQAVSARAALTRALSVFLRLFAPFMPFVTEEVWSWMADGSIHTATWPTREECVESVEPTDPRLLEDVAQVLREVRRAKTEAKRSMPSGVDRVIVHAEEATIAALELARDDLSAAGNIATLDLVPQEGPLRVEISLSAPS